MNKPNVVYRNQLLLVWLSTCLGISYSIAQHFIFGPCAPSKKNIRGTHRARDAHFIASAPGAENPSYATVLVCSAVSLFTFLQTVFLFYRIPVYPVVDN